MDGIINVFLHGLEGKTKTLLMKKVSTIDDLFKQAHEKTGIPLAEMRLISGGRQLQQGQGKTLADFNIQNLSTVMLVLRLRGGSNVGTGQTLTALPGLISLTTTEEDMISLDADPGTPRAVMPCGHVIGQESMKSYCESLLSNGQSAFRCPYVDGRNQCSTVWDFHLVSHVAGLNPEEQKKFGCMMAENYLRKEPGVRKCPRCASWCERTDRSHQRVACPRCSISSSSYEFCWICLGDWATQNHGYCGVNQKLNYLKGCTTKEISGVANCPVARACPRCGVLIEHTDACKHMKCKGCDADFCFTCLRLLMNGSYQCGTQFKPCVPAPVQTHIPGE